jgi:RNA polymerase sigma-70 factor (ECF subfamily)
MNSPRTALELLASPPADEPVDVLDPAAIFRRFSPYVAAVAQRLLGRDSEVDDTVQEVFIAALRGLAQLRDPGAIKGWLARVTVRVATRRLRARRVYGFLRLDTAPSDVLPVDRSASPEQRVLLASLYRALDELPAAQRVAWTLRHVEGERLDSVATLCGCSLATAKRRIAAAERWLEEVLADV